MKKDSIKIVSELNDTELIWFNDADVLSEIYEIVVKIKNKLCFWQTSEWCVNHWVSEMWSFTYAFAAFFAFRRSLSEYNLYW